MKHTTTKEIYSYWNRIKGSRTAPDRGKIEPFDIQKQLKDVFILELDGGVGRKFRLAGTRTCALFRDELKGSDFISLFRPSSQEALESIIESVTLENACAVIGLQATNIKGQNLQLEMLLLPVRLNGRTDLRIMGSLAPMRIPEWFGLDPVMDLSVTSLRLLMPGMQQDELNQPIETDEQHSESIFSAPSPASSLGRKVGHLHVIEGGRL